MTAGRRFTLVDGDTETEMALSEIEARAAREGRPLAVDRDEGAACLGVAAATRAAALASLAAPDFTLPDLAGRPHTLSAQRGRKVLLVAYASW